KRALLCVVLASAACVDLDRGRPWRCDRSDDCSGGWVCLKDHSCHDPAVGAAVPCGAAADCPGGWFCGQAGVCLDPSRPAAFPCSDDSQCAGAWRCGAAGVCVDFAREPQPGALQSVGLAIEQSPRTEVADFLRAAAPWRATVFSDGALVPASVLVAARVTGTRLQLDGVSLVDRATPLASNFVVDTRRYELGFTPRDVAVTAAMVVVQRPDGRLALLSPDGGLRDVDAGTPGRLVPLSWSAGQQLGAAVLVVNGSSASLLFPDGRLVELGSGIVDAAARLGADGGPGLWLLRPRDEAWLTELMLDGEKETVLRQRDGGFGLDEAQELRVEQDSFALRYSRNGTLAQPGVRLDCPTCDEQLTPMVLCERAFSIPDFGVVKSPPDFVTPEAASLCGGDEAQRLLLGDHFIEVRPGLAAGTSGNHVRQLPGGQLVFGRSLLEEVPMTLATRPRQLGELGPLLVALDRHLIYAQLTGGLELTLRADDPDAVLASLVEGTSDTVLFAQGYTMRREADGGEAVEYFVDAPENLGDARAELHALPDGGAVFVVADGDTLYAAARVADEVAVAGARLKPAAGFALTDVALRPASDGVLEGWAVANNRLFRLTASTPERWRSSEVSFPRRDPLAVWFSGDAALLGTVDGEVLALPSGVPMSVPLGADVTSIGSVCGATVATTSSGVWQLEAAADGGLATWSPAVVPELDLPEVFELKRRLFVTDATGVVLELPVACP
ncbi:MAG: hypothetical protein ACOZQL_02115, partial [Myxococcota bacterium]